MKLTPVRKNDSKSSEYELYIDGEFAFTISEEDYIRFGIYDKKDITTGELDRIRYDAGFSKGVTSALKYVTRMRRTEKQTEEHLLKNGFTPDIVSGVLEHLSNEKYLDDSEYARLYIKGRVNTTDKSLNRIINELIGKGISEEFSEPYVSKYKESEFARAFKTANKRFGSKDGEISFNEKQKILNKIYQYLIYRGYEQETIYDVMNKLGYDR